MSKTTHFFGAGGCSLLAFYWLPPVNCSRHLQSYPRLNKKPMHANISTQLKRAVVVAMVAMRMMETSINQVVNMVAMWNSRVAAIGAMSMLCPMFGGGKARGAFVGV